MYNPSAKTGILLPEFPKVKDLNFVKPFPIEKVRKVYHIFAIIQTLDINRNLKLCSPGN